MEDDQYEALKGIAQREGKAVNIILQSLVTKFVKDHGRGNDSFELSKWVDNADFQALPTLGEDPEKYPYLKDPKTAAEINVRARIWVNATSQYLPKEKVRSKSSISVCRYCGVEVDYIGHPVNVDHMPECPIRKIRESNKAHLERLRKERETESTETLKQVQEASRS